MKGRQVVLGRHWGAEAAALMVDGRVEDLLFDLSPLTPLPPGAICRAVVDRLVKGQGGVFVRLPEGERGFLRDARGLSEGQTLIVQVSGAAEDGKAIPVTQRVLFRGRAALVTPGAPGVNVSRRIRDDGDRARLTALGETALRQAKAPETMGLVIRSAAALLDADEVAAETRQLAELAVEVMADTTGRPELLVDADLPWHGAWIDWADPAPDSIEEGDDSFDAHGVSAAIDTLLDDELDLPGGGFAVIESTRALIAVDVNTGRDTTPAAALKVNIALARELPRQLRLRGLGGQIVIDFAPSAKRDRGTIEQVLRAAFKAEGTETTLIGWTAMGLFELNRKRDRVPLAAIAAAGELP